MTLPMHLPPAYRLPDCCDHHHSGSWLLKGQDREPAALPAIRVSSLTGAAVFAVLNADQLHMPGGAFWVPGYYCFCSKARWQCV